MVLSAAERLASGLRRNAGGGLARINSGDGTTPEPYRRITSEPSQMQGCDKRTRADSGLPPDLTILLRISVEATVTVR